MKIDVEYSFREWIVPSVSNPGFFHDVSFTNKGNWWCDCVAGVFKRPCKHKKACQLQWAQSTNLKVTT